MSREIPQEIQDQIDIMQKISEEKKNKEIASRNDRIAQATVDKRPDEEDKDNDKDEDKDEGDQFVPVEREYIKLIDFELTVTERLNCVLTEDAMNALIGVLENSQVTGVLETVVAVLKDPRPPSQSKIRLASLIPDRFHRQRLNGYNKTLKTWNYRSSSLIERVKAIQDYSEILLKYKKNPRHVSTVQQQLLFAIIDENGGSEIQRYEQAVCAYWIEPNIKGVLCEYIIQNYKNVRVKILASQRCLSLKKHIDLATDFLVDIVTNGTNTDDVAADAADVLIQHSTDVDLVEMAQTFLIGVRGDGDDIYAHPQSVHLVTDCKISRAIKIIQDVASKYTPLNLVKMEELVGDFCRPSKVNVSGTLQRFRVDSDKTIASLLEKVVRILAQPNYPEVELRRDILVDELQQMQDTCASGHSVRLLNVFVGGNKPLYDSLLVDWKREMSNVFQASVLKHVDKTNDEILSLFGDDSRASLRKFCAKHLPNIRKDMYEEFKEKVSDSEFDLYFGEVFRSNIV